MRTARIEVIRMLVLLTCLSGALRGQQPTPVPQNANPADANVSVKRSTAPAAGEDQPCAGLGIARVALRDEKGVERNAVSTLAPEDPSTCVTYAALPGDVNGVTVVVWGTAAGAKSLVASGGVADTASGRAPDSSVFMRFTPLTRRTQRVTMELSVAAVDATKAATTARLELYLARVPTLRLADRGATCDVSTVCVFDKLAPTIIVSGTNLEEIDETKPADLLVGGVAKGSFPLDRAGPDLVFRLPADAAARPSPGVYDVRMRTRSPYRVDATRPTVDTLIVLRGLRIASGESGIPDYHFTNATGGETTLWVGESITRELDKTSGLNTKGGVYTVTEGQGTGRHVVAILEMVGDSRARLTGVAPTVQPFRRAGLPMVDVVEKDSVRGHMLLQVVYPPHVERIQVHHLLAAYSDSSVRRRERVVLTIVGTTLGAFGSPAIESRDGTIIGTTPRIHTDREIVLDVEVAATASDRLPIVLRASESPNPSAARDTAVTVPVSLPQRPRTLEFARVATKKQMSHRWLLPRHKTISKELNQPSIALSTSLLDSVVLDFNPRQADPDATYGPQYLVVDAAYYGPTKERIARDSVRVVVVPEDATPYQIEPGYSRMSQVSVDQLLANLPRYARPGAYVEINVKHDPAQYGNRAGEVATIQIGDNSRWSVTPRFDVLTGLTYVKRHQENSYQRQAVPNGGSVPDTLIRRTTKTNYDVDFLDVTGGASAALDFARLEPDFKPSWARLRLGLLFVSDPFTSEHKRRFGATLMYPVELLNLRGGIDLSLGLGYGWLLGGRDVYIVAPGVGFTLPKP